MFITECLNRSKLCLWLTASALVASVAFLDVEVGVEISFSVFYLVPVALVTWFAGRREGDLMILLSTLVRGWIDWSRLAEYSHVAVPIAGTAIRVTFFVLAVHVIFRVKDLLEKEKKFGTVDYLTGLANSRAFYDSVEREASRCRRKNQPLTLAFMDCDDFKRVNDTRGHRAGDEMLRVVAETMQSSVRAADVVARVGGDEFAVALPETGEREAAEVLGRLHARLTREMENRQYPVTFSVGAVTMLRPPDSVDEMIHLADELMYEVKNEGKNTVKIKSAAGPDRRLDIPA